MATIKGGETRNIFEPNYGFTPFEWEYHEDWTIQDYIQEHYEDEDVVIYVNLRQEKLDYILEPNDKIAVGVGVGEGFSAAIMAIVAAVKAAWVSIGVYGQFIVSALAMTAFSMLVNMLLAPDPNSIDDAQGADQSKAYQWGGLQNTSSQMIPINVTLGEMLVAGNLIAVRTESQNVQLAGYSIRDTAYFLYGLTSNELASIEEVYINDMPVSTFDADDISIYYTLGTGSQEPINSLSSTSMLTGDTTAPAGDGIMFPSLTTEIVVNQELENPDHFATIATSGSVLVGYEYTRSVDNTMPGFTLSAYLSASTTTTFQIVYSTLAFGSLNAAVLARDTPFYIFINDADGTYQITGEYVLCSGITYVSSSGYDETFEVTISKRSLPIAHTASSAKLSIFGAIPVYRDIYTASAGGDTWNPNSYVPSSSWSLKMSTSSKIEDVEIELTHPRGLHFIYGGTHSGVAAGAKFARWTTYDYHIKQWDATGSTVQKELLFTSPDTAGNLTELRAMTAGTQDMPRGFFSMGTYTSARVWSIKFTDIIREKANYPLRYSNPTYTELTLDSDGYLEKGYRYSIEIRIHGHGNSDRDGALGFYTFDPQGAVESNETDVYGTVLYRFKELNYGEVLSYPYTALLAVAANATPTINNSMPRVTAKVHSIGLVGSEVLKNTPSLWSAEYTQNPGWLALTVLWNGIWGGNLGDQDDASFIEKIDIDSWIAFADYCDEIQVSGPLTGKKNYIFNGTFDTQSTLLEAVGKIVAVANASIIFDGSKLGVYYETDTSMTQLFTPGNIIEDSLTLEYINSVDTANAISGNFVDSGNNYEKTSMSWIYPDSDPRKSTSVELIGVTEEHRALRALQYKLNKTNGITVQYSLSVLSDALRSVPGDVIGIENEFIEYGVGGGRLQAIDNSTGVVTLDRIYEEVTGTKYLTARANDGTLYPSVTTNWEITAWDNTGDTTKITVGNTIELVELAEFDVFLIGVGSDICRKAIIMSTEINSDFTSSIVAMGYVPFSEFDQGIFVLSTTQLKGITQEDFCPRNITLTADKARTSVVVAWDAPLIAYQTKQDVFFEIYRYSVWRRQGTNNQWMLMAETTLREYKDEVALGSVYYYKVLPIFNYYGAEATIPMSWCSNFTDSGNADVASGIDFTFSIYEYLPIPILGSETTSVGYKATVNTENDSLRDLTVFIEDPDDWLYKDKREGFGFWLRTSDSSDTSWLGNQTITLNGGIAKGASALVVSSVGDLCIPGLIVIDNIDLVYVSAATSTTLTVPYGHEYDKFSIGKVHASGVKIKNAHLGLNPVKYFAFASNVSVICASRQITASTIYKYDAITNTVSSGDFSDIVANGLDKYRLVQGISNHGLFLESVTASTIITRYDIPEAADMIITSSHHDAFGYPVSVAAAMWQLEWSELKINDSNEIYFTFQGIPPFEYVWFGLTRIQFPIPIDEVPLYGWASQVSIEGV